MQFFQRSRARRGAQGGAQHKTLLILVVLATSPFAGLKAAMAAPLTLVENRQPECTIVVPDNASAQVRDAASLLAKYVRLASGASLPIESDSRADSTQKRVHVGLTKLAQQANLPLAGLDSDGFVIQPLNSNNLVIVGPGDWGTEFGVDEFLEQFVGVRWLMPGDQGTFIPNLTNVTGPITTIRQQPAFFSRELSGLGKTGLAKGEKLSKEAAEEQKEWARRNRMHSRIEFHHNLANLFPPAKYKKSHPQFFPKRNGRRALPQDDSTTGWQPCFSDPALVTEAVKNIRSFFDKNPASTSYSLGVNDGVGYCDEDVANGGISDNYYSWCNAVVTEVLKTHPDKWFGCLAYGPVAKAPQQIKLHPRLIPFWTQDRMAWADTKEREKGHRLTEAWQQASSTPAWYDYVYGGQYLVPRVYFHQMGDYLRYGYNHGVRAYYAEAYPNWGEGPKLYVTLKLLWSPQQDVDALVNDWYTAAAGQGAAPHLSSYYRLWENFWTGPVLKSSWFAARQSNFLRFKSTDYLELVTPEMLRQSRASLAAALNKTKTQDQRARVQVLLDAFNDYEANVRGYRKGQPVVWLTLGSACCLYYYQKSKGRNTPT